MRLLKKWYITINKKIINYQIKNVRRRTIKPQM